MIPKDKLIEALDELLKKPGDTVLKTDVNRALTPFLKKNPQEEHTQSAIGQLDEILRKFKKKKI